jgi:hypothetical protein
VLVDVGGNQARVDGEPLGADQPFRHATRDDGLEQMPQDVALAKAPMPVLRKGRVIRNLAIETETAKPRVSYLALAAHLPSLAGRSAERRAQLQHPFLLLQPDFNEHAVITQIGALAVLYIRVCGIRNATTEASEFHAFLL